MTDEKVLLSGPFNPSKDERSGDESQDSLSLPANNFASFCAHLWGHAPVKLS
jgi:hypothetical protein